MSDTPLSRVRAFQRAANPNGDYHWPAEEAANVGGVPLYFDDIEALSSTDDLDAVEVAIRRLREAEVERNEQRTRANIAEAAATTLRGQRDAAKTRAEQAETKAQRLEQQHATMIAAWKQGNARQDRLDGLNDGLQRSALEDAAEQRTRSERAEAALAEMRGWYDEDTAMLQRILEAHDEDEAHDWIPDNLNRTVSEMRKSMRDRLFQRKDAALERAADEQGDGRDHTFEMLDDDAPKQNPRAVAEYWHEWADTCSNGGRDDGWTTVAQVIGRILAAMDGEQGVREGGGA